MEKKSYQAVSYEDCCGVVLDFNFGVYDTEVEAEIAIFAEMVATGRNRKEFAVFEQWSIVPPFGPGEEKLEEEFYRQLYQTDFA